MPQPAAWSIDSQNLERR